MSTRPMSFDIVTPKNGGEPWLRVRAAGNRTKLLRSETYSEARTAANVVHLIVEAIQTGNFVVRYVTEDNDLDESEPTAVQGIS